MNRRTFLQLVSAAAVAPKSALAAPVAGVMVPVLTRSYDNSRSGSNSRETILTRASVLQRGLSKLFTIPVYGDARGMEAQPLILPSVKVADGSVRDLVLLPSMANQVRCVDASDGSAVWNVTLGRPVDGSGAIDFHNINQHWGVLSTPVIDNVTNRAYIVAWISADGTPQKGVHFMFVLNMADGSQVCPPVTFAGLRDGKQSYSAAMRKQRSALLLTRTGNHVTVFCASGTVQETGNGAAGWIFAFDCGTNTFTVAKAMSQGRGAGIWMGGQGLAADPWGDIYAVTGNGSFNAYNDFGEAAVKLRYTVPTATTAARLDVIDWWAPYSDAGRVGQNPQLSAPAGDLPPKVSGISKPSEDAMPVNGMMPRSMRNARRVMDTDAQGQPVVRVYPANARDAAWSDEDLGSAGAALIPRWDIYLISGKDGIAYPVKMRNMGKTQPADFANAKANCAKLSAPPVWMTASPGRVDPCPQDVTTLNFMPGGKTRHMHSTPIQYWHPTRDLILFAWGENSQCHAWSMDRLGNMKYLAQSAAFASANVQGSPGGMPGGFMTLSSNNFQQGTALLFASIPLGDANREVTGGRLLVLDPDPDNYVNGVIPVLWDSQQWGIQYTHNKFNVPVVSGGKLFLPNYSGSVDVYG